MEIRSMAKRGILSLGDESRFYEVMEKAERKEPLTIGFIGGSITQGSLSSSPTTCYAYRVYQWWREYYHNENLTYWNAGIGATTSQFGVSRVKEDLLSKNPEVIFAEFSVNDEDTEHFMETYEGLVRTILPVKNHPALFLFHNVQYDTGENAQRVHSKIGFHYQIPMVSMKNSIYEEVKQENIRKEEITPDNLHPNDRGHELVAFVITQALEKIEQNRCKKRLTEDFVQRQSSRKVICDTENRTKLPSPITLNRYEGTVRYRNQELTPALNGFVKDEEEQYGITDLFKGGYQAYKVGDSISFEIEGTMLALQYRKTIKQPAPIAKAVVDGREDKAVLLDANFTENWGDCLYLQELLVSEQQEKHTVTVTIIEAKEGLQSEFYLASLIVKKQEMLWGHI